ncbi:flagellar FliJ family protein [Actinokineospora inagensis]|uniref:flagellar FliJ family protein n=1 Tax=Actinokineospora inagensis TaxID=103730 RepID=UPI00041F617C|nr:flagellar FliJ family protein [Actinokineospora inagensis]
MTIRTKLAAVLRARKAQEDIAKGELTRANARLADAGAHTDTRAESMRAWAGPRDGDAASYLAAIAAGRALAAALSEARAAERAAHGETEVEAAKLREAAKARRGVEKLVERATEDERLAGLAAEQKAADEVAVSRHGRGEQR